LRPTMSDVAAAASVSKSTVSRALSGDSRVKYETRVRIMRIAQELGYTPSFSATALARGRTWMIGVATPGTPRGFSRIPSTWNFSVAWATARSVPGTTC